MIKLKYLFLIFLISKTAFSQNFSLLISEIMYNPEGNDSDREWIEIVNISSQTFNIFGGKKGWRINDGENHLFEDVSITLNPNEILVIVQDRNKFLQEYPNFKGKTLQANFYLKNESGTIQIYDQNKNLITQTTYTNSYGGNGNGYSIIYKDGWKENSIKGGAPGTYAENETPIANITNTSTQNILTSNIPTSNTPTSNTSTQNISQYDFSTSTPTQIVETIEPKTLIISEFFPNTEGNDYGNEFVEIYNYGGEIINLEKFLLQIGNKKINLKGNIEAGEYFVITNKEYNFSIRNSGETLKILYQNEPIFEISYQGKAPEGKSFSKFDNEWLWTKPTPGKENIKERKKIEVISKEIINSESGENFFNATSIFAQANPKKISSENQNIYYILGAISLILALSLFVAFKL